MPLRALFIEEVTQSCTTRKVNVGRIAEKVSPFGRSIISRSNPLLHYPTSSLKFILGEKRLKLAPFGALFAM